MYFSPHRLIQGGGILASFNVVLQAWRRIGTRSALKALYHSEEKPSGPGDLFVFRVEMALFSSISVIEAVNVSFCSSDKAGKLRDFKKSSICWSLSNWGRVYRHL